MIVAFCYSKSREKKILRRLIKLETRLIKVNEEKMTYKKPLYLFDDTEKQSIPLLDDFQRLGDVGLASALASCSLCGLQKQPKTGDFLTFFQYSH